VYDKESAHSVRSGQERKGKKKKVDVGRGLMLFSHAESPLEILVVGSFSFLLKQNWATAKGLLP
jgi:hypothetical protein